MPRYIIKWRSKLTDKVGQGKWEGSEKDAQKQVEWLNKRYPTIHHWKEMSQNE